VFDNGRVDVPLNHQPPAVSPGAPMGEHPVIIRLQWPDGEEWRPGIADRWTATEVRVRWRDEHTTDPREHRAAWLPVADVARVLRRDPRTDEHATP
jgi:hypothetical protein